MVKTYEFDIVVVSSDIKTADDFFVFADRIYEAGCDDALVTQMKGKFTICFMREDLSITRAVRSAINDLTNAGFEIQHVIIDDEIIENWSEII